MPYPARGTRLYLRKSGIWIIRDPERGDRSTGTRNRRAAEGALARYLAERDRPSGPATPDALTAAEALELYGTEHAPTVKDPVRIGHAIAALVPIVGSLPVAALTSEVCRRYAKARGKAPGTIRKELGTLQAALNYCHAEGYLSAAPKLRLPAKPPARDRWLTRGEVAKLLRAAYRKPAVAAPCPVHSRGDLHGHEVRGHSSDAIHAEHRRRMGRYRTEHHAPTRDRGGRHHQAAPADPSSAPASRPSSAVGTQRRPLRGRS